MNNTPSNWTPDTLWQQLRQEANHIAATEPVLTSYVHNALLHHATLPEAVLRKAAEGGIEVAALGPVESDRLHHDAEKALYVAIGDAERDSAPRFAAGEYIDGLSRLAALQAPVDAFFDGVMVNAEDAQLRANRLALLRQLHLAMNRVADLSRLAQ